MEAYIDGLLYPPITAEVKKKAEVSFALVIAWPEGKNRTSTQRGLLAW